MALTVKHSRVSAKPDGPDSSQIQPSDWNADHQLNGLTTVGENLVTLPDPGAVAYLRINADGTVSALTAADLLAALAAVSKAGDSMTGELRLPASTTNLVPLNIPHGATPTVLENGDFYTTTASLLGQINGATRTFIHNGNPTTLASDVPRLRPRLGPRRQGAGGRLSAFSKQSPLTHIREELLMP